MPLLNLPHFRVNFYLFTEIKHKSRFTKYRDLLTIIEDEKGVAEFHYVKDLPYNAN